MTQMCRVDICYIILIGSQLVKFKLILLENNRNIVNNNKIKLLSTNKYIF